LQATRLGWPPKGEAKRAGAGVGGAREAGRGERMNERARLELVFAGEGRTA